MSAPKPPYIILNGEICESAKPIFIANSRLPRYGDGFFETIRLMNGRLNFMNYHHERVRHGIEILKLSPDSSFTSQFLESEIERLIECSDQPRNARIRLTCYRAGGGLYEPIENRMGYILELNELELNKYTLNEDGLTVDVYESAKKTMGEFATVKSCNSLVSTLASIWKKEMGLDDAIVLNAFDRLSEGTSSNLFFVRENVVYTPSLNEGCVAGVMRRVIIEICNDDSIEVVESGFEVDELLSSDEVFFTNATMGLRWVSQYGEKKYSPAFCAGLVKKLNEYVELL